MDKQWLREIESKELYIFGCGATAVKFCESFGHVLQIKGFLSNNIKETIINIHDREYEVKRPQLRKSVSVYIIVCSNAFEHISQQLNILGYQPFKDYIDYQMAEYLLSEKNLVVLYGFCHLRAIKDYLHTISAFYEKYNAYYYSNYLTCTFYDQQALIFLVERCKVFIYNQSVTLDYYSIIQALITKLDNNCIQLCLPSIFFGGYFPQKSRVGNKFNKYAVKCENHDFTPFSYEDNWLNECIDKGMSGTDIWSVIQEGIIGDKDFILENLDKEWKRNQLMESKSDFRIVDYLKEHFRKQRLFRNEAHMENPVIYQYVLQILEYMGVWDSNRIGEEQGRSSEGTMPDIASKVSAPLLNCSQHIIYPEVGKILELEWDTGKEELELYTYNGWTKVKPQEYIIRYVEMCGTVRRFHISGLLP